MKTAVIHIAVIEFSCSACNEHISSPSGSHMFELYQGPEQLECDSCGAKLKVPAKAKKLKEGKTV